MVIKITIGSPVQDDYLFLGFLAANKPPCCTIELDSFYRNIFRRGAYKAINLATPVWDRLNEIILNEGVYRGICTLDDIGALRVLMPELTRCKFVDQNPNHHPDNVFKHCLKVCASSEKNTVLRWAGLLHDIGKYKVVKLDEDGLPTFHKHEIFSTIYAEKILKRLGAPREIITEVTFLISKHMYHYSSEWTDKTLDRFIREHSIVSEDASLVSATPIFRLREADRVSRGLVAKTPKQGDFEKRISEFIAAKGQEVIAENNQGVVEGPKE